MTSEKTEATRKALVISKKDQNPRYMMAPGEFTNIIAGAHQTGGDYVITDGTIAPGSFVPDHYHKWEDQTFHVIEGELEARIGGTSCRLGPGDSVQCPRGVPHYIENVGATHARLVSYIFPGDWAEAFFAETSRQSNAGERDAALIEERFGVVYV